MPELTWTSREELRWERDRLRDLLDRVQGEISSNLDDRPLGLPESGEPDLSASVRDRTELAALRADVARLRATAELAMRAARDEVGHLLLARPAGGGRFCAGADAAWARRFWKLRGGLFQGWRK